VRKIFDTTHFADIEPGDDRIPDATTIQTFRHLPETHALTGKLFAEVNDQLADQGITLRFGTLVDATIIDAPSSTMNEAGVRDPEMSSTKKGNERVFGMKASHWCRTHGDQWLTGPGRRLQGSGRDGQLAIDTVAAILAGETVEPRLPIPLTVVTPENVEDVDPGFRGEGAPPGNPGGRRF